ncbi:1,4-alpha-glucan-branching enzyme isoform X1 [Tachysurus ichikawai]
MGEEGHIISRPLLQKPRTEQHFAFNHRYQSLQADSKRRALSSSGAEWEMGSLRITPRPCTLAYSERRYKIKLDTDAFQYGGHGRLDHSTEFFTEPVPYNDRPNSMQSEYKSWS